MKNILTIGISFVMSYIPMIVAYTVSLNYEGWFIGGSIGVFAVWLIVTFVQVAVEEPTVIIEAAKELNNISKFNISIKPTYYLSGNSEVYIKDKMFNKPKLLRKFESDKKAIEHINVLKESLNLIRI